MGASGGRGDEGLADVAELADASDLGSGTLQCAGSSPVIRTKKKMKRTKGFGPLVRFLYWALTTLLTTLFFSSLFSLEMMWSNKLVIFPDMVFISPAIS